MSSVDETFVIRHDVRAKFVLAHELAKQQIRALGEKEELLTTRHPLRFESVTRNDEAGEPDESFQGHGEDEQEGGYASEPQEKCMQRHGAFMQLPPWPRSPNCPPGSPCDDEAMKEAFHFDEMVQSLIDSYKDRQQHDPPPSILVKIKKVVTIKEELYAAEEELRRQEYTTEGTENSSCPPGKPKKNAQKRTIEQDAPRPKKSKTDGGPERQAPNLLSMLRAVELDERIEQSLECVSLAMRWNFLDCQDPGRHRPETEQFWEVGLNIVRSTYQTGLLAREYSQYWSDSESKPLMVEMLWKRPTVFQNLFATMCMEQAGDSPETKARRCDLRMFIIKAATPDRKSVV